MMDTTRANSHGNKDDCTRSHWEIIDNRDDWGAHLGADMKNTCNG